MNNCRPFNLHSEIVTRVEKVIKKKERKKLSSVKLSFHLPIIDNGVWPFSPEQRYISINSPFCSLLHFFSLFFFFFLPDDSPQLYFLSLCNLTNFLSLSLLLKQREKEGKEKRNQLYSNSKSFYSIVYTI